MSQKDVDRGAPDTVPRSGMLDAVETLADLLVPPGNRLEKLTGDRGGQYSIRISQRRRICLRWSDAGPEDIEIVD